MKAVKVAGIAMATERDRRPFRASESLWAVVDFLVEDADGPCLGRLLEFGRP